MANTRVMNDSIVEADAHAAAADLYAGYINGNWPWAANPKMTDAHQLVTIDVSGSRPDADVLDVEKGDASVGTAVTWVKEKLKRGDPFLPVIYANRSTLTPLFNAMQAAGYTIAKEFKIWIATLDGTPSVADMTGVVAVQYQGTDRTGGHFDRSIVYDNTWKALPSSPGPRTIVSVVVQYSDGTTATLNAA